MNLFRIFNHDAEKLLALDLAEQLAKNLPPAMMNERRQVISPNKVTRLLEQAFETAKDHQKKTGMGFIKRSVFANSFKWALQAKGYPRDFIEVATEGLVVELSIAKRRAKKSGEN